MVVKQHSYTGTKVRTGVSRKMSLLVRSIIIFVGLLDRTCLMHVCMYVCVFVCAGVCMCVCLCKCVCVFVCV